MNEKKKKESKKQIQSLAELCINKIYEKKILEEKKSHYNDHLNFIKSILVKKDNNNPIQIKQELKNYHQSLILSNNKLKTEKKNLYNKLLLYQDNISKEGSFSDKQKLINMKSDNLLLIYKIKEKDDIINRLNKALEANKKNLYFKEDKRETSINDKWGKYYLTLNLNDFAEKMMEQCQYFNQSFNKCFKKEKEKNTSLQKKDYYNEIIQFYNKELELGEQIIKEEKNKNKRNKNTKKILMNTMILKNEKELSLFEPKNYDYLNENLLIEQEQEKNNNEANIKDINTTKYNEDIFNLDKTLNINNETKEKKNKNKKKNNSKIEFLTVDELFDVDNHEGKEEAIIDEELHSDEGTIFDLKIKPLKKINIHYLPKIRKQVPFINLSQIEYNKKKVMNEADLYSLQRRKLINQNVDENIKNMKKKVKKYKHMCKLNKKKVTAFENYAKNMENNYKALKPLKIQSSLSGVNIPKNQDFFRNGFNYTNINDDNFNDIDLGDDDDIENFEEDDNDTINTHETYNFTKISNKNIDLNNYKNKLLKKKETTKKITEDNYKSNKPKSK